jgi:hypothetical protein
MALQVTQNFETPIGTTVPSTYWRWVGLGVDVSRLTATVTLYGYVDAQAFGTGKANIGQRQYTVSGGDFVTFASQIDGPDPTALSTAIYAHARAVDEFFADAQDV